MGNSACTQVCKDTDKDAANQSVVLDANAEDDYNKGSFASLGGASPSEADKSQLLADGALIEISRTLEDGSR